ncbi:MAG: nitrogenase [Proteobacteria bacterium]|nr:nitrogenase [Pseudomonadota bacterium]
MKNTALKKEHYEATTNACKLCTPLGASLAFKGVRGAISLMHGSQGCSTYIRRYLISHFKEPIDIASSNFSEDTAIFGGGANLKKSVANVIRQYKPELVGISTTCLSETIGDDVPMILNGIRHDADGAPLPPIVHVSTPSYSGTHADGYVGAVRALVDALSIRKNHEIEPSMVNIFPGMYSPADLRYLKEILEDFAIPYRMLPDYSETLDGGPWTTYHKIPHGGTSVSEIADMASAQASIEFGYVTRKGTTAAGLLSSRFNIPAYNLGMPAGVRATDRLFDLLSELSGNLIPDRHARERERLLDSYVDGHKYLFGAKAVIYGEEDLVAGMFAFLTEIGITPILCASGGTSGKLAETLESLRPEGYDEPITVLQAADFGQIEDAALGTGADMFVGNSKGYSITRKMGIPLVRVGFPIHDRVGGPRIHHIGYRGCQELFDRVTNALLDVKQEATGVGYSYM